MNRYSIKTLPSGLRIVSIYNPYSDIVTVRLCINAGARYEENNESGFAHALEHMLVKGSLNFSNEALVKTIDHWGAYFNASTSKEDISIKFQSVKDGFSDLIKILADAVINPALDSSVFNNEKKVISEEKKTQLDNPSSFLWRETFANIFQSSSLANFILGDGETIKNASRDDLLKFTNKHFSSSEMILFVSGGVESVSAFEAAEKNFGNPSRKESTPSFDFRYQPINHHAAFVTDQTHLNFVTALNNPSLKDIITIDLAINLLANGRNSLLYKKLRSDKGLVYTVSGGEIILKGGSLIFIQTASSNPEIVKNELFEVIAKLREFLTNEILSEQKEKKINSFLRNISDPEKELFVLSEYAHLSGEIITPDKIISTVKEISLSDLKKSVVDNLRREKFSVISIGR